MVISSSISFGLCLITSGTLSIWLRLQNRSTLLNLFWSDFCIRICISFLLSSLVLVVDGDVSAVAPHLKKNYNHVHKEAAVHMLIEKSLVLNSSKV